MAKLFTDEANPAAWKILVAAKYAGFSIEVPSFTAGQDNKTAEFEKKSPLHKFPVLETANGAIFEPNAAARYVARHSKTSLFGNSDFEAAQVDQWIDFSITEIDLPASVWVFPILGLIQNNPTATTRAKGDIRKILEILNNHLADKTFLVGERISLADIVVATSLHRLYTRVLDHGFRKGFGNTDRWFTTVVNQPPFLEVAGNTVLASKMEVAPSGGEEVKQKTPKEPKEPKAPKESKPKEAAAPKETPAFKPAALEDDDDEAKEEKVRSKLDLLPKSKFVLDDWKRTYSNEETRAVALPYFWTNYDREGYSIWFCDYKHNNEFGKVFMAANLVSGFFQRLEKLHKYAFGSFLILGEDDNIEITGVWVFRGTEIPDEMKECDDSEQYSWKKADIDDAATKELINDYFAWDSTTNFGGRKLQFNQGKAYK